MKTKLILKTIMLLLCNVALHAQLTSSLTGNETSNSALTYTTNAKGDRLIDYSYAGYKGSEEALPNLEDVVHPQGKRTIKLLINTFLSRF